MKTETFAHAICHVWAARAKWHGVQQREEFSDNPGGMKDDRSWGAPAVFGQRRGLSTYCVSTQKYFSSSGFKDVTLHARETAATAR